MGHGRPVGQAYALRTAQRNLATRRYSFVLGNEREPDARVRVDIEPQGEREQAGREVATYRRTLVFEQDGREIQRQSALTTVDCDAGQMVSNEGGGMFLEVERARSLPERAFVGEGGTYFEATVFVDTAELGRSASSRRAVASSFVSWALEAWDEGLALWRIAIESSGRVGPVVSEAYIIGHDGQIKGAALIFEGESSQLLLSGLAV